MIDKLEKVKAEIERLMNELIQEKEKGFGSDIDDACILELQNVLTFIDSMQEEPKEYNGILGENIRKIDNEIQRLERLKENPICAYSTSRYTDVERRVLCDDCDEPCEYAKKEPVIEDLEEAANNFIAPYHEVSECGENWNIHPKEAFKAGAEWQKKKYLKEQVEREKFINKLGKLVSLLK